jgi:Zn-finger nucleic acid-binding protein
MPINCPQDSHRLEMSGDGYTCVVCEGRWLPRRWLEAIKHEPGKFNFSFEDFRSRLETSAHVGKLLCPEDRAPLAVSTLGEVELDWCQSCSGVWFERSEMEKAIALWRQPNRHSAWAEVDVISPLLEALLSQ